MTYNVFSGTLNPTHFTSPLCTIVCNSCALCNAHTYEQTNSSLDWVLSHWAHFTVLDSFLCMYVFCVYYHILYVLVL